MDKTKANVLIWHLKVQPYNSVKDIWTSDVKKIKHKFKLTSITLVWCPKFLLDCMSRSSVHQRTIFSKYIKLYELNAKCQIYVLI